MATILPSLVITIDCTDPLWAIWLEGMNSCDFETGFIAAEEYFDDALYQHHEQWAVVFIVCRTQ